MLLNKNGTKKDSGLFLGARFLFLDRNITTIATQHSPNFYRTFCFDTPTRKNNAIIAAGDQIKTMIANVRKGLNTVLATAPQLTKSEFWRALIRYIIANIIAEKQKYHAPPDIPTAIPPLVASG